MPNKFGICFLILKRYFKECDDMDVYSIPISVKVQNGQRSSGKSQQTKRCHYLVCLDLLIREGANRNFVYNCHNAPMLYM